MRPYSAGADMIVADGTDGRILSDGRMCHTSENMGFSGVCAEFEHVQVLTDI